MKRLLTAFLLASALCSCSCNSGEKQRDPIPEALEQGRKDAARALRHPAGSMDRERAILGIRAKEENLRRNGFGDAADDYASAADSVLTVTSGL